MILKLSRLLITNLILLIPFSSLASNTFSNDKFRVGGTASLYSTSTTDDINWFDNKNNPLSYSQATIFGHYAPLNNITFRGEAMIIEARPRINYALTDISGGDLDALYGIRLGKFQRNVGLYSDVRFNSAKRRFIFLPTALYYPATEEWTNSSIGGQIYLRKSLFNGRGNILFEIDHGIPWVSRTGKQHQFSQIYAGQEIDDINNLDYSDNTFILTQLTYQDWRFLALYNPNTSWKYTSSNHPVIPANEAEQETVWLGVEYRNNKLLASIEGYRGNITTNYTNIPIDDSLLYYNTYAFTVGYDITNRLQISGFTSQIFLKSEDDVFVSGSIMRTTTRLKQRDSAITARYKLTKHINLRAEAHYFNGNPINVQGFGDDNNIPITETKNWGLFTIGVDFVF